MGWYSTTITTPGELEPCQLGVWVRAYLSDNLVQVFSFVSLSISFFWSPLSSDDLRRTKV
jgi:hypothetical protein